MIRKIPTFINSGHMALMALTALISWTKKSRPGIFNNNIFKRPESINLIETPPSSCCNL